MSIHHNPKVTKYNYARKMPYYRMSQHLEFLLKLTIYYIASKIGKAHFKNLTVFAVRFSKCVETF